MNVSTPAAPQRNHAVVRSPPLRLRPLALLLGIAGVVTMTLVAVLVSGDPVARRQWQLLDDINRFRAQHDDCRVSTAVSSVPAAEAAACRDALDDVLALREAVEVPYREPLSLRVAAVVGLADVISVESRLTPAEVESHLAPTWHLLRTWNTGVRSP
ncbi:MAG: hypothetical protein FJ137_20700 [Deltaproteobacteria bacterium]|nr:hypothetical protein [Deltaproteobacteria bacterium]